MRNIEDIFSGFENYIWSKNIIPVRVSTLVSFLLCPRRSYIKFILENTPPYADMRVKLNFEKLISQDDVKLVKIDGLMRARGYGFYLYPIPPPNNGEIYKLIKEGSIIPRNLKSHIGFFQVQGVFNRVTLDKENRLLKGVRDVRGRFITQDVFNVSVFQVKLYGWIISNYFPIEKIRLAFVNRITKEVIGSYEILFKEDEVEHRIVEILEKYRSKELKFPDDTERCDKCPLKHLCSKIF